MGDYYLIKTTVLPEVGEPSSKGLALLAISNNDIITLEGDGTLLEKVELGSHELKIIPCWRTKYFLWKLDGGEDSALDEYCDALGRRDASRGIGAASEVFGGPI